jgi:hypothetical protein
MLALAGAHLYKGSSSQEYLHDKNEERAVRKVSPGRFRGVLAKKSVWGYRRRRITIAIF